MNVTATLIGQMITFAVLVWFIKAVLWEPMTQMLADRQKKIADGLAAAERGKKEQELAEAKAKELLKEAKEQASEIIAQAQKRGTEIIEEAKDTAKAEADRLKTAASAEIEADVNRAKEELRGQVVSIAVSGAERVLKREIDEKAHASALDDLVAQI